MKIAVELEQTTVPTGHTLPLTAWIECDEPEHVELFGQFQLQAQGVSEMSQSVELFTGELPAGRSEIPLTIGTPAGPATYDGRGMKIRWKFLLRVRSRRDSGVAEAPVTLMPSNVTDLAALPMNSSVTTVERGPGVMFLRAVMGALVAQLLAVVLAVLVFPGAGWSGFFVLMGFCAAGPFLWEYQRPLARILASARVGRVRVQVAPDRAAQGTPVHVVVESDRATSPGEVKASLIVTERYLQARTSTASEIELLHKDVGLEARQQESGWRYEGKTVLPTGLPQSVEANSSGISWKIAVRVSPGGPFALSWQREFPLAVHAVGAIRADSEPVKTPVA